MVIEIIKLEVENMQKYKKTTNCNVFSIHVKITDIAWIAREMVSSISDTSWITQLWVIEQTSYATRAQKTILKIVEEIIQKVENEVTSDFWQYLISESARIALNKQMQHKIIPLSELWKEKVTGNPWFDFHTETSTQFLAFWESKYNSRNNSHNKALLQIIGFIKAKKDEMEFVDLKNFCSSEAMANVIKGDKAYIAAFSLHKNFDSIFSDILNDNKIEDLLKYKELYLIWVEIWN